MLINHAHKILIYSQFGRGKTTLSAELAAELLLGRSLPTTPEGWEEFSLAVKDLPYRVRLITAEHYGSIREVVKSGLVEVWQINLHDYPFETLRFASQGYWPEEPLNPTSKLIPPTSQTWERYPIRVFEGLATLSSAYLAGSAVRGGILDRVGRGEKLGNSGESIYFMDGETGVGGFNQGHYGQIQNYMESRVVNSGIYPGYTIWTSHEDEVKEKVARVATGRVVVGPEVFGEKYTTIIGKHFDDVWHLTTENIEGVDERVLYVTEHGRDNLIYLAKNSAGKYSTSTPSRFKLTIKGEPRMDVAKAIVEKLRLR